VLLTRYYEGCRIKKEGSGGTCGACRGEEYFVRIFGVNLKERGTFEDPSVD
jgi:hypothetical protein